ncbi:hypothetical protein R1flu_000872 [Riccia fluitans]|uniref:DEUBAD domain-containing protein n=1 Tax=Riccia fluitans TaxID=41844 RepID=A0ABD1Y1Q5_9MARC
MDNEAEVLRRCLHRRPHVVLAWDDTAKKVVAPATQVGMTWNHASTCSVRSNFELVDNVIVPEELFEIKDLDKILTMEAWVSCLTEPEKKFLSSYLPEGVDQKSAVQALLNGENLHFGNPRHTWGVSVCSGAMHPDKLIKRENVLKKSCKTQKKHLRVYHNKMLQVLQKMKDIWSECESNGEVLPRIYRWLKSTGRGGIYRSVNGSLPYKRACEIDVRKAKLAEETLMDHKTTRKDRSVDALDRHKAKRLKTDSGGGFVDEQQVEFSENEFFQKYIEVSVGALLRDQLSEITLPVKVTRQQFEKVKSRTDAGEEVDFDSLEPERDNENVSDCKRKKKEVDKKDMEELKRYWCEHVVKSLPDAHTRFSERKARLMELADSIAQSCKEERAYVVRQYEEHCSPESAPQRKDDLRIPVDASDSEDEEETLSRHSSGKDLLVGRANSEDAEEEFNSQSPEQEEAMDLDSAGEREEVNSPDEQQQDQRSEEDVNSPDEKQDQRSTSGEKSRCSGSSVARGEVDTKLEEEEEEEEEEEIINFAPEKTSWKRSEQADEPSLIPPTTRPDDYSEEKATWNRREQADEPSMMPTTTRPDDYIGEKTIWKRRDQANEPSVMSPTTMSDDYIGQQREYGDNHPAGFGNEQQPFSASNVLSSGHRSTFSEDASTRGNFRLPEKQELQLLPHPREPEVPELHTLGSVPQSVQDSAQLFSDHPFENPIASLINFSKRQRMLNNQPPPLPLPQNPYDSYTLPSSAPLPMAATTPLPMALPVVDVAPMWHRSSPASGLAQYGGHVSDSTATRGGGGWGLSEALQNASRRAQQQQVPLQVAPAPIPPRWEVPNHTGYITDQAVRKPERMFGQQQQFYSDWQSRGSELPVAPPAHTESTTAAYRPPSWYPTGPFDNAVGNALSGNQIQAHLPHQRHPLWPPESAPPKSVPQLWGNMNWRPS